MHGDVRVRACGVGGAYGKGGWSSRMVPNGGCVIGDGVRRCGRGVGEGWYMRGRVG